MLDKIAQKHNTDKRTGHHGFTTIYEKYFSELRTKKLTILEIGVKEGASVRTWAEYFPNSRIIGIDINKMCLKHKTDRIDIFIGDQGDVQMLNKVANTFGGFDIIIDDGSHKWGHQIQTFDTLFPWMKPGGIYVIEDLITSYDSHFKEGEVTAMEYLCELSHALVKSRNKAYPVTPWEYIHFYKSIAFIKNR